MKLHSVFADLQGTGNLTVRQSVSDQRQNFALAASERFDGGFNRLCCEPLSPRSRCHQDRVDVEWSANQSALDVCERCDRRDVGPAFDLDLGTQRCCVFDGDPDDEDSQPTTHMISLAPVSFATPFALRTFANRDLKFADLGAAQNRQRSALAHTVAA